MSRLRPSDIDMGNIPLSLEVTFDILQLVIKKFAKNNLIDLEVENGHQ
jgi:hypothetical protein